MKVVTIVSLALGWNYCSARLFPDAVASAHIKRKLNVVYVRHVTLGAISYVTKKDGANVFRVLNAVYGNDEI